MDDLELIHIDGMAYRKLLFLSGNWWFVIQDGGCNVELRQVV